MSDLIAVNLKERIAIDDEGTVMKITNMFDEDGQETDDPDEAIAIVVMAGPNDWIVLRMDDDPIQYNA